MRTNPKNIKIINLCWLAGILEGEGSFPYQCSPGICIGSTDKDIVERVAKYFDRKIRGAYKYKLNKKPVYYTEIWGIKAIEWMKRLYPLMGIRRKQKIKENLKRFKKAPGKGHNKGKGEKPLCHPLRPNYAFRLCSSCYKKMKRRKEKINGLQTH
jgi:hypothetical protein